MIRVGYFANIREMTGKKWENMSFRGSIKELMLSLCGTYGTNFRSFCMDGEAISRNVNILINGKHIKHIEGDITAVNDGDEVSVFPLIGGG